MARERLRDAGLAAAALVAVLAVARVRGAAARPAALALGVASVLLVEFVLQRHHAAVRRAWSRPRVKLAGLGAFAVVLALASAYAPAPGLSALAGGLLGYLAMLAGSAAGGLARRPS